MLQIDLDTGNDSNSLDLLVEVARCFGNYLQEVEVEALQDVSMQILESDKCGAVMKKKAVAAISALAPYFTDALLSRHVSYSIERLRSPHVTSQQRRLYITVYGSLARSIPQKFGPYLKTLAPFVLAPLSEQELEAQQEAEAEADGERDVAMEDVREAALIAIEAFLHACAADMRAYTKEVVESATRFLKYEPNVADDDEDMEQEEQEDEFGGDEDFEEETGFDDEDDVSWKVRRCSAKALHALIATLDPNDPAIYGQIAPALISRFKESEESVRVEVLHTLAFLITKTGGSSDSHKREFSNEHVLAPTNRKRRRAFSDSLGSDLHHAQNASMNGYASPSTPPPVDKASQGLATINPEIVRGAAKLLKTSTIPTKQAVIGLLKAMVSAQKGGLSDHADQVVDPAVETMSAASAGGASNVAGNALKIEVLQLLKVIADNHSGKVLEPHMNSLIPAVAAAAKDKYAKVAVEAFACIESFVKALTPPRSSAKKGNNDTHLGQIYAVVAERINATDTDTEVRQKAVQVLGLLIGRTSGTKLLPQAERYKGQRYIAERLKNELTRLDAVRAIDTMAVLAQSPDDFSAGFLPAVTIELGQQLRKANRSLRGASLSALRMIALNHTIREQIDDQTLVQLVEMLVSLLKTDDLHMMGPALIVLAAFAKERAFIIATPAVISGICNIVQTSVSGAALDALITCVEAIGRAGAGQELMKSILSVGVKGDVDTTGQVIGTLLVSGGDAIGIKLEDFVKEVQSQGDETRKCLALTVLGEASLRLSTFGPLGPQNFTKYFADPSDKVKLAAAIALGRAGAGNVKVYLPQIMDALSQGRQYLLLHTVKELLQHSTAEDEIKPYTQQLWQNIINSGQAEDNKVVGAECIGRLAIIDPAAYLSQLQKFLQNPNPTIRGMVISALRFVFSETDDGYNPHLQTCIIPMLATMLADRDLDNQRLALSSFNSALHNKPELVLPHLADLLPYAMQATIIRPELVKEVQMGPFKHKVDDGLDIRKAAYETLYALLDSPASRQRLDFSAVLDRIVAGLADEHEIKVLSCLVLGGKLVYLAPAETAKRLDSISAQLRASLANKPKENAVKQELEKANEGNKAAIKCAIAVGRALEKDGEAGGVSGGFAAQAVQSRKWREFMDWVRKEHPLLNKAAEDEIKEVRIL
jgi:cullin-associated NEDD8-dissociated protein 1